MGGFNVKKYVSEDGTCYFQDWYDGLCVRDQQAVDSRLATIEAIEGQVPDTYLKKIGTIWEIRCSGTKALRPLCVIVSDDVVILIGASKKAKKLKKSDTERAERIAGEFKGGKGKTKHWTEV